MTKEQQEEEFKRRFGDNPTFNEETCIELLKFCSEVEDITRWNEWRRENPEVMIILSEADLKGATLIDADLNRAILIKAHLEGAIMYKAQLYKAILTGAFLQGVDLGNAILEGADLNGANLGKASIDMQTNPYNSNRDFDDDVEKEKQACLNNANLKGAVLANANLEAANLSSAIFENADLSEANLKDAKLINTNLKNANLRKANLTGANLWEVDLEDAKLFYAILEGTSISGYKEKPNLKNADFTGASVNGKTIIQNCDIDEKTDFSAVNLDSARVEPKLLTTLKTNIRRISWGGYYEEKRKILTLPMRFFWWLSDYGSSPKNMFVSILLAILLFTDLYLLLYKYCQYVYAFSGAGNSYLTIDVFLKNKYLTEFLALNYISFLRIHFPHNYIVAFLFSAVNMVTLGFGGISVIFPYEHEWIGDIALSVVAVNLIFGYLILSVLITYFGVLMQSNAPESNLLQTTNYKQLYIYALILFIVGNLISLSI